ncbi:ArsR family transcriptional regulator [Conexibacter stalactiti]|uniref:ArsR family transcriptional regulator n=1 Tax=Conexibacter stalactiti TaxID=1940611 RepID=A0ABU4HK93_9ACTN|nr:ArsR family transcriptional regulator [Conexibacter stalactiti]MDW5593723.1 ArsR family transcriptional regulator [Conexibacter stalactiti]MEC5034364.1 ArsR family transcriptional regulator [Conexibacter stalactiti]
MEPGLGPVLAELPPTRRALLVTLRKRGEARAEELALELGVTVSAVRQHLQGLAAADLVVHTDERSGPGRPRRSYQLGPAAEALFPKSYGTLTLELLDHLADEDPGVVQRAFEKRRAARVERVRARMDGLDFAARVAEIARVLDEDGYLADFEPTEDGEGFLLREHNCAILAVARRYGHACSTEIAFLRELLPEADVRRVAHILSGSHACVYEVRPRAAAAAG